MRLLEWILVPGQLWPKRHRPSVHHHHPFPHAIPYSKPYHLPHTVPHPIPHFRTDHLPHPLGQRRSYVVDRQQLRNHRPTNPLVAEFWSYADRGAGRRHIRAKVHSSSSRPEPDMDKHHSYGICNTRRTSLRLDVPWFHKACDPNRSTER